MSFVFGLVCGIFIGATYPFIWGMIKSGAAKALSFVKKNSNENDYDK